MKPGRTHAALSVFLALAAITAQAAAPVSYRTEKGGEAGRWTYEIRYPRFGGSSPLAQAATREFRAKVREDLALWTAEARKTVAPGPGPFTYEARASVSLNRPGVVSGCYAVSSYLGGAHGANYYKPVTVALVRGRPQAVGLRDLFRKDSAFVQAASDCVMAQLRGNSRAEYVADGTIKSLDARQLSKFMLTPTGITFLFDPYVLGSYSAGPFEVKVPYRELRDVTDPSGPLKPLL